MARQIFRSYTLVVGCMLFAVGIYLYASMPVRYFEDSYEYMERNNLHREYSSIKKYTECDSLPLKPQKTVLQNADRLSDSTNKLNENCTITYSNVSAKFRLKAMQKVVKKLHEYKWKRSSNALTFPIPSYDGRYLMNCPHVCSEFSPIFMCMVHTSTDNFHRRQLIRNTWGGTTLFQSRPIQVVFLLGKTSEVRTQRLLDEEQDVFGDLVQGTFLDTYRNLTHKTVLGLRWASEHCRQASFIVRVDDDVFVNTFQLFELKETIFANKPRHFWCPVHSAGTKRIQRNEGKYIVNIDDFTGLTYYPVSYCSGFFSIITTDLVEELFLASTITTYFWIEDVYVGLLADAIGGVTHERLPNAKIGVNDSVMESFQKRNICNISVVALDKADQMYSIWTACSHLFNKNSNQ